MENKFNSNGSYHIKTTRDLNKELIRQKIVELDTKKIPSYEKLYEAKNLIKKYGKELYAEVLADLAVDKSFYI